MLMWSAILGGTTSNNSQGGKYVAGTTFSVFYLPVMSRRNSLHE